MCLVYMCSVETFLFLCTMGSHTLTWLRYLLAHGIIFLRIIYVVVIISNLFSDFATLDRSETHLVMMMESSVSCPVRVEVDSNELRLSLLLSGAEEASDEDDSLRPPSRLSLHPAVLG